MNIYKILLALIMASAMILSCSDSKLDGLKSDVDTVKAILDSTGANPMAAESYAAAMETGGNIITYIAVNLPPESFKHSKLESGRPTRPWSVVIISGAAENEYVIEGYGEDISRPVYVQKAMVHLANK